MGHDDSNEESLELLRGLWQEFRDTPFPSRLRGKDVNRIDFVLLDADIAGCVQTFLKRGTLNAFQIASLGLAYRNATYVIPILYKEGASYFRHLEQMAELVLQEIVKQGEPQRS